MILAGCSAGNDRATGNVSDLKVDKLDHGKLHKLVKKNKRPYTLVSYYKSECQPCELGIPELADLQREENSKVQIILVAADENADPKSLAEFLFGLKVDFKSYYNEEAYEILIKPDCPEVSELQPPFSLLYKEGVVIEKISGFTDRQEVEMLVNKHEKLYQ